MIMKILKKRSSREEGGGGNEIHAPCACENYLPISRSFSASK
jgi:hypothetical protein